MLVCIKTCVLKGGKRIIEGQTINESQVSETAMKHFETLAINPAEVKKSLQEVCYDIIEIKKRLDALENKPNEIKTSREELEKQAHELGIEFHHKLGDKTLIEKINSKLAE